MENDLFWTLRDYQRFVQDPDFLAREWAAHRIEEQYPQATAHSLKSLLFDEDDHLRISAARAIITHPSQEFEADLLYALQSAKGNTRSWILKAIGVIGSKAILPQLIQECDAIPIHHRTGVENTESQGLVNALGEYPEPEARAALWRLMERYRNDDVLANDTVVGLLNYPEYDTFTRLTRLIKKLRPAQEMLHFSVIDAIAGACLVSPLAEHLHESLHNPEVALDTLYGWMDYILEFNDDFQSIFYKKARQGYTGILEDFYSEANRYGKETGQDWSDWKFGETSHTTSKGNYQWRMFSAYQFLAAFAENPPQDKQLYRRTVGLCLALLGQFLIDEDDEALLIQATTPESEFNALVEILNSARENVLPDIVERLAAHGPIVLPALVSTLQLSEYFWPRVRALNAISQLAQLFPGTADPAIPAVLDQIQEHESDIMLEAASQALKYIGPSVVKPAMEGIDYEDHTTYNIYVIGALTEIPTQACVEALLNYINKTEEVDKFYIEVTAQLAHPRLLPLFRSYYLEDPDPNLAEYCYKVAYLNRIDDPLMAHWKTEALELREKQQHLLKKLEEEWSLGQAVSREKPEQQPLENILAKVIDHFQDSPSAGGRETEDREENERARQKEAARRAEAKEKSKRKQEKISRKKSRKRK